MKIGNVMFRHWQCIALLERYKNGRSAITLITGKGEPVACATVNVPEAALDPDEVIVKDWSENSGMLDALIDAGIVFPPHRSVPLGLGFVVGHVCKLKSVSG